MSDERAPQTQQRQRPQLIVVRLDPKRKIVEINRLAAERLGYTREELIGRDFVATLVGRGERQGTRRALSGVLGDALQQSAVGTVVTRSGEQRSVLWTHFATRDERGAPSGSIGVGVEVAQAAAGRPSRSQTLAAAVAAVVDGVLTIDHRGTILSANRATQLMFGFSFEELIGRDLRQLVAPRSRIEHDARLSAHLEGDDGGVPTIGGSHEAEAQRKDGTTFPVELVISEVGAARERVFACVIRDISDRRRAEAAEERLRLLQLEHVELERAAVAGEMAAIMAHEIRTPLNALAINVQMAERALRRQQGARALELLDTFKVEIQRINGLLEDYLKLVRPAGAAPEHEVSVNEVVGEAAAFLTPPASRRKVQMRLELAGEQPRISGVRDKLRQVVLNLLLNAVQAMPDGGEIAIRTAVEAEQVCITVADSGPGIALEDPSAIFRPFVTTKAGGTGLGLAICDRIVRQMRGTITLRSDTQRGATFDVRLPLLR